TAMPPMGEKCSGVMMGTPVFSWSQSGAEILPGCIVENLTSVGGAMTTRDQTKSTEFLRHGAAASSGTVTEPYTIPNKFPHPMLHVHYVDGLTAAEAYYSSVTCPYQLLMVGDPLCQPYCKPPRFTLEKSTDKVGRDPLLLALKVEESNKTTEPEFMQLYLDGVLRSQTPFDPNFRINFNGSETGAHEVRVVAISAKPIEERFQQATWVVCGNADEQLQLRGPTEWRLTDKLPLKIELTRRPESGEVSIFHDAELVGRLTKNESSLELSPSSVGYGPVRFQAIQKRDDGVFVPSLPITIQVMP
ncbi:MAG: hypothetical protein ABL921_28580, partial [Pirellula sp.]